ncbi:thioester domain-containing protein [Actinoplanes derwentensis]|uniref:LPXTG-motif cell wall anchor domain-containing protein/TQXA domain-containing protein n=1 Tax=Actinoplanes derwentensis TaxID=113562 RepID=A0A1H2CUR2_9ACTN|nr:thioester domain-containing protein [Actinoplanes derwentensis]GID81928.1 TQXA domain-containing protein [Actinoplanes derwentensis]SDT74104.1 LPXTG-motif cell wall anchor domain-containing protein/TQXA domain-containing protein [Actinoplanes derwentensis]
MFGKRGHRLAQAALAAVAGSALLLGSAMPAAADEKTTGVAISQRDGVRLVLNGEGKSVGSLAFSIQGGQGVPVYCIDFHTPVAINEAYDEGTWSESEVKNLNKVQWVLSKGYPNGDAAQLLAAAGASASGLSDATRDKLLYFGTQTAVWHFSDGITLGEWNRRDRLTEEPQYDVIKKVYDYLTTKAVGEPEPKGELSVDPASATAAAGEKAGPFTVKGPAGEIKVTTTGGSAVDANGTPVSVTGNGGQFWLTGTEAGKASVSLTAEGAVSFGRVFLFRGDKDKHQKLILGTTVGDKLTAGAEASFTVVPPASESPSPSPSVTSPTPSASVSTPASEEPTPSQSVSTPASESPAPSTTPVAGDGNLPLTGSSTAAVLGGGFLLLVAGAVALIMVRRRRVTFTS